MAVLCAGLLVCGAGPAGAQIGQEEYAARRGALARSLPGDGVLLVLGAPEPRENHLAFHQALPFNYLTGFLEPSATLLMVRRGEQVDGLLFVQPRNPAEEVWTGARLGVEGVRPRMGLEGRDAASLVAVLDSLMAPGLPLYVVGDLSGRQARDPSDIPNPRTGDDQFVAGLSARYGGIAVTDVTGIVSRMRGTKSPAEVALLRGAARVSAMAHREVLHAIAPDVNEFEIHALADFTFRRNGGDGPGYPSIVGSGPNSTTLHYNRNDRFMQAGEVVNMDMAASYGGYTADVTRTVPVSGTFSEPQRAVYGIVLTALKSAERQVAPGNAARLPSDSATMVIQAGLAELGLIEAPDATYDCGSTAAPARCPQYTLYYMHGLSHGIGLDVHDPDVSQGTGTFTEGSAFTIEPGIYVRENTVDIIPDVPANAAFRRAIAGAVRRFANIGVRIEDDYVVTATGVERLSAGAPREIVEIEREMAVRRPPSARDPEAVEAYRRVRE